MLFQLLKFCNFCNNKNEVGKSRQNLNIPVICMTKHCQNRAYLISSIHWQKTNRKKEKKIYLIHFFLCFSLVADGIKVQSRINQNLQLGSYEENRDILNKADLV